MTGLITAAIVAALAGTPHCVGMCGGLVSAASEGGLVPYHLGRIGTYALLGALAGFAGRWIPGPSWLALVISGSLVVAMAASLAGLLPEPSLRLPGLSRLARWTHGRKGPTASLSLGVLNGLLPCGLLYGTLALPVASGSAAAGVVIMTVFGIGTAVPLTLTAASLRGLLQRHPRSRYVLAAVVLVSGLSGLSMRIPASDADPGCSLHDTP